ncbi:hypothetical protein F5888DRAFT_1645158 [Russula emetica]|nr:hypothetical protein F5888DRAFT_1645158 [Russula emetica]
MGPVHFKLSMSDGLTRRISFNARPSWSELATRIHSFCSIPRNRLAMSYVDSDGDEVTLSSEEELRDFYDSNVDNAIQGNQLIRFHVVELGSLRDNDNFMEPISPSSTRNTFGRPTPFVFVDHDQPPFGPFGDLFIPSPLEREVDSPHAFVEVVDDDGEKEREYSDVGDKGKARDLRPSVSDDISSSGSVIADETPRKPPIHVQVHGLRPMDSGTFGPPPATSTPARESVTPTLRPVSSSESPEEAPRDLPGSFPDPPTPELGAPIDPNVTLSNDLASLLDSLNSMFLEHPDVGQHLRGLFRNVGNGSYWDVQRDSVARVAQDIQRVARDAQSAVAAGAQEMARNIRQQAQQEAARRVTESVGNILRAFGASGNEVPPSNANIPGSAQMSSSANVGPASTACRCSSSASHPPEVSYYTASANREPRPNTSERKTSLDAAKAHYKAEKEKYRQEQETKRRERWLAKESAANSPMSPEAPPVGSQAFTSMALDAESSRRPYPSSTVPPLRQIISNARGRFPQLEMFNVPHIPTNQRGDDKVQHVDSVMGRLEGMGFHEASFPTMRTVVESHLPADGSEITKRVEDDVMSEVLEKLLETSGSGSGMQPTSSSK